MVKRGRAPPGAVTRSSLPLGVKGLAAGLLLSFGTEGLVRLQLGLGFRYSASLPFSTTVDYLVSLDFFLLNDN